LQGIHQRFTIQNMQKAQKLNNIALTFCVMILDLEDCTLIEYLQNLLEFITLVKYENQGIHLSTI
jgi:hypothetical protein